MEDIAMDKNRNKVLLPLSVGFGVIVIVVAILYSRDYISFPKNSDMSDSEIIKRDSDLKIAYNEGVKASSEGDFDNAIESFRNTILLSSDKESEGKYKVMLAGNLLSRNTANDATEAFKIYKEVADDVTMPSSIRALALNNIATNINGQTVSFYKLYLPESLYQQYIEIEGTDSFRVSYAYKMILEKSLEIHPTSYAYYAIAGNYYAPALSSVSNNENKQARLDGLSNDEMAIRVQRYVAEGDALRDENLHVTHVNMRKYFYRALAVNTSGRVLGDSLVQRESGFLKVVEYAVSQGQPILDERSEEILLRSRFYHAAFLLQNTDSTRRESIVQILKDFGDAATGTDYSSIAIRTFFLQKIQASDNNIVKERSAGLAELSPEFATFLEALKN